MLRARTCRSRYLEEEKVLAEHLRSVGNEVGQVEFGVVSLADGDVGPDERFTNLAPKEVERVDVVVVSGGCHREVDERVSE